MSEHQTVSYKGITTERGTVLWYVTIDGRILGDSRPYDTAEAVSAECHRLCEASVVDGMRYRTYRPGYKV